MGVADPDKVPVDPDKALAEVVAEEPAAALAALAAVVEAVAGQSRSRAYWNSLTWECMG